MDYTGVSARQRAGTLERVVKHDQEAFTKAWDYLAKSPNDDEDDKKIFFSKFFFPALFYSWKRAEIRPFWGRPTFFRTPANAGWCAKKTKKQWNPTQKTPKNSKKSSPVGSNSPNGLCNHNGLYLWDRGRTDFK